MKTNAVCVTVYKNRFQGMINLLKTVSDEFDVFIIAQKNDPNLNEYYEHGIEVLVPDVTSIFQKREYIRCEMTDRGYDGFFMFDDDIKKFVKITEETKRTTSNSYYPIDCDFKEVLNKMLEISLTHDCAFVSINYAAYIGFEKPEVYHVNKHLSAAGAATYIRTEPLKKYNIHYDVTGEVNEDIDILIKFLQHGCNCSTISCYAFRTFDGVYGTKRHLETSTLFKETESFELLYMKNTLKYHLGIRLNKNNRLLNVRKYEKYFNTFELPEIDENILNFCEKKDILGLKTYLADIKNEKNKHRKGL